MAFSPFTASAPGALKVALPRLASAGLGGVTAAGVGAPGGGVLGGAISSAIPQQPHKKPEFGPPPMRYTPPARGIPTAAGQTPSVPPALPPPTPPANPFPPSPPSNRLTPFPPERMRPIPPAARTFPRETPSIMPRGPVAPAPPPPEPTPTPAPPPPSVTPRQNYPRPLRPSFAPQAPRPTPPMTAPPPPAPPTADAPPPPRDAAPPPAPPFDPDYPPPVPPAPPPPSFGPAAPESGVSGTETISGAGYADPRKRPIFMADQPEQPGGPTNVPAWLQADMNAAQGRRAAQAKTQTDLQAANPAAAKQRLMRMRDQRAGHDQYGPDVRAQDDAAIAKFDGSRMRRYGLRPRFQ